MDFVLKNILGYESYKGPSIKYVTLKEDWSKKVWQRKG